jgi:hypothetical protein
MRAMGGASTASISSPPSGRQREIASARCTRRTTPDATSRETWWRPAGRATAARAIGSTGPLGPGGWGGSLWDPCGSGSTSEREREGE